MRISGKDVGIDFVRAAQNDPRIVIFSLFWSTEGFDQHGGLNLQKSFVVDVLEPPRIPCGIVRVQNSARLLNDSVRRVQTAPKRSNMNIKQEV